MRQRIREIDFIRAVSALAVIAIHVTGVYTTTSRGSYMINQMARFAVPMFILISGFTLMLSGYPYKGVAGYVTFLSKRLKKIYIPYLIWSLLYILFNMREDFSPIWTTPGRFIREACRALFYGTSYSHLYFVIIIVQLYLLFPALLRLMYKWRKTILVLSLMVTLIFQAGIYLQSLKVLTFPVFLLPNYIFFPTWIFYFVFGMYAAANMDTLKQRITKHVSLSAVLWFVSFVLLMIDSRLTNTFSSSMKPSVMLYSIASFLFMYSIAVKIKDSRFVLFNILDWISQQSFLIYLSHMMIMKIIMIRTGSTANFGIWTGFKGMVLLYIAAALCTFAFSFVVSLIPAASFLGGVKSDLKIRHPSLKA